MGLKFKLQEFKYKYKQKIQRFKKGYANEDVYSLDNWFSTTFVNMLYDLINMKHGYPCDISKKDIKSIPKDFIQEIQPKVEKLLQDNIGEDTKFDINDGYCIWIIILYRMAYCFKMSNSDNYTNKYSEQFTHSVLDTKDVNYETCSKYLKEENNINEQCTQYKNEACKLLSKYFYDLWD